MTKTRVGLLFLVFFTLQIFSTFAQVVKPRPLSSDWETWLDIVNVSADLQVGLMNEYNSRNIISPTYFYSNIPKGHQKNLCVEISSQNGNYSAKLEFDIKDLASGIHQFQLPTAYTKKLKELRTKDLAILARGSNNCQEDGGEYYAAHWTNSANSDSVYVLLNAENPTSISYVDAAGKKSETKCNRINNINAVSFNCLCTLAKKDIKKASSIKILHRSRKGGRTFLKAHDFSIKL